MPAQPGSGRPRTRRISVPRPIAVEDEALVTTRNPWWFNADWAGSDPHLRRLDAQRVKLPAPLVQAIDLTAPGIHTIRGPRQVGKSTDLKLLVQRALREGYSERRVIYLALDLLEDQPAVAVAAAIEQARTLAVGDGNQCLILLDEVSAVSGWQIAVKELWDRGVIDRDVVICTGSSAIDLAAGTAERLPGRRGHGRDHLVLPQSFDAFGSAVDSDIPPSPHLTLKDLTSSDGRAVLNAARIYLPRLHEVFTRYMRFGGLPAAVVEAATGATEPSDLTRRILWDSLTREVLRKGASEPAARALLERVVRSLGSKTNWSKMAREMSVPLRRKGAHSDYRTVQEYIEFLAVGYFILVVYFWRMDADSNSLAHDKKMYFGDPLLHEVAHTECCPGRAVDVPALVENLVALGLYRKYEPVHRQVIGFLDPGDLHIWQTSSGTEVDFVCGPRSTLDVVEVKWENRVDRRELSGLRRAFPGRRVIIATKSELELSDDYALIPAPLMLWALGDAPPENVNQQALRRA